MKHSINFASWPLIQHISELTREVGSERAEVGAKLCLQNYPCTFSVRLCIKLDVTVAQASNLCNSAPSKHEGMVAPWLECRIAG